MAPKRSKRLRTLLHACRELMSAILTVSHDEQDEEWSASLEAAEEKVREAIRIVRDRYAATSQPREVEHLANNLAKLYVQDMLAKDERRFATERDLEPLRDGFHGYAWAVSITGLLSFLQVQAKTGTLRVNIGTEVISLVLEEGDLVSATSDNSPPGLRLGEILVEQGRIDPARLEAFLVDFAVGREPIGEALEREGLVDRQDLEAALELQVRLIFTRLLCSENAYFRFQIGGSSRGAGARYNITQLLLDSYRIQDEVRGRKAG